MLIDRLRLQNFRQHEDTELVLGAGLTGIIGPNGAGKTTLLEAIAWAMYGTPAARGTRESIRRRGAPPRAPVRVELDFTLGPHHYRVVRGLVNAELFQDGDPSPIANSLQSVSDKVSRLLGMNQEEFFNTYFTGQKELAVMAAMKPVERAQFLSRVLGYEKLRVAQDRLREEKAALKARLQGLAAGLPELAELEAGDRRAAERLVGAAGSERLAREAIAAAEARRAVAEPAWLAMQKLQETVRVIEGDLRVAEHKVLAARTRFQGLDLHLVEANQARGKLEALAPRVAPLEALRAERQLLDRQAEAHAGRQAQLGQLEELRRALAGVAERLRRLPGPDQLAAVRAELAALRDRVAALASRAEAQRTDWVRDLQDARSKRENLLDQYRDLKDQYQRIHDAGAAGVCPTCSRPLGEEFDTVLGLLERQLQEVLFNGHYFKQRIEQLQEEPPELVATDQELAGLEREQAAVATRVGGVEAREKEGPALREEERRIAARIADLEQRVAESASVYDLARHREVRRLLEEIEPVAMEAERLKSTAARAETLVREAEEAERELSAEEARALALRERMASLGYSEEAYRAARETFESAERGRRDAELALARAGLERQGAEEAAQQVARRRAERAERARAIEESERELAITVHLDEALRDLRTDLNTQLRPDLSDLASAFLGDLSNGRYSELELDEDHVPVIVDDGEAKRVISGGEEDIANLALRLAISQMIAERAGQPLSLLVLDEIFGSLDEERRAAVLDLLRSLADRFPQVILITHIESVREGFDRVIRVEADPQSHVARVRDEEPGGASGLAA
jgi:DNA repair protein SbcC/Rad50